MNKSKLIAIIAMVLSVAQTHATAQTTTTINGLTNINAIINAITNGIFTNGITVTTTRVTTAPNGQPFNTNAQFASSVTLRATFLSQNSNSVVNPTTGTITTAPILRQPFTTFNLLRQLAIDANISGRIPTTNFAPGAQLMLSNNTFFVTSGSDVVDVSDIMTFTTGINQLVSGSTDVNGLARPTARTIIEIGRITFNDTDINTTNGLLFFLQGIATQITSNSPPNTSTGTFVETRSLNLTQATGEGTENVGSGNDRPIIISGVVTARGTGTGNISGATTASTGTNGTAGVIASASTSGTIDP